MFQLALELRDQVGCVGMVVDAKPTAIGFYRELGFEPLDTLGGELAARPASQPMFLPIRLIARAAQ